MQRAEEGSISASSIFHGRLEIEKYSALGSFHRTPLMRFSLQEASSYSRVSVSKPPPTLSTTPFYPQKAKYIENTQYHPARVYKEGQECTAPHVLGSTPTGHKGRLLNFLKTDEPVVKL